MGSAYHQLRLYLPESGLVTDSLLRVVNDDVRCERQTRVGGTTPPSLVHILKPYGDYLKEKRDFNLKQHSMKYFR